MAIWNGSFLWKEDGLLAYVSMQDVARIIERKGKGKNPFNFLICTNVDSINGKNWWDTKMQTKHEIGVDATSEWSTEI